MFKPLNVTSKCFMCDKTGTVIFIHIKSNHTKRVCETHLDYFKKILENTTVKDGDTFYNAAEDYNYYHW